jgi:ribosomal protein S14
MHIFHCLVRFEQIWNVSTYFSDKVIWKILFSTAVELLREEVRTMGKTEKGPDEANMRIKKNCHECAKHHRSVNTFGICKRNRS